MTVAATAGATTAAEGRTALLANVASAIDAAGITGLTIDASVPDTLTFSNTTGSAFAIRDGDDGELGGNISVAAQTPAVAGTLSALAGGAFTINGEPIEVGTAANAATRASDLAAAINAADVGVRASVQDGALRLSSDSDIVIGGTANVLEQTGLTAGTQAAVAGTRQTGFAALDISTPEGADNAMLAMDAALKAVNDARADLGAVQNRFSSVVTNLQTGSENLSAARSRIMDADYAKETANLSRTQILAQAGTAMLAQANQSSQSVLSLLR